MAIFGNFYDIKHAHYIDYNVEIWNYLENCLLENTIENNRLKQYSIGAFEKIFLNSDIFALGQVYITKPRERCQYESHKKYIDIQLIVDGKEIIEVSNSSSLDILIPYDNMKDVMFYKQPVNANSRLILNKGDIAIFYPFDAHMPCVSYSQDDIVIKTVVKIPIKEI